MQTSFPAVQAFCSHAQRYVGVSRKGHKITRRMTHDPETFYNEGFNTPSLSSWDLW